MAKRFLSWCFLVSLTCQECYAHSAAPQVASLDPRATPCGVAAGACPAGLCCSRDGQCGTGHAFCGGAGNCQQDYSDSCESQLMPAGASLLDLPRPVLGDVPYAKLIQGCSKKGSIAIAFDDGPATNFTSKILDLFASYRMKATFFVTGHNFAKAIDNATSDAASVLRRMHAEGHQIGSHTWTHENLTLLTNETQLLNQIHYNEMALRNVLGFIPTYFRPPYLQCRSNCLPVMSKMGYHVIMRDLETNDFDNNSPDLIQNSKDAFVANMKNVTADTTMYITLNHDIRQQTAYNLTDFMLNYLVTNNFPKAITVGECLGDPADNWYRKTPTGPDPALSSTTAPTSTTGSTGSTGSTRSTTTSGSPTSSKSASTTPNSAMSRAQIDNKLYGATLVLLVILVLMF